MIIVNMLLATIANLNSSLYLIFLPNYRISNEKFFLIYAAWGAILGNIKYIFDTTSTINLVFTIINNVGFWGLFIALVIPRYYKFIIGFALYALNGFTGELVVELLGLNVNSAITENGFTDIYLVHILWTTIVNSLIYLILRNTNKKLDSILIDSKGVVAIVLIAYYCTASRIYMARTTEMPVNMSSKLSIIFISIISILIVVKTIIENRKRYIAEYRQAYENENTKLNELMKENEYIAKLRHDYINQINVVRGMAKDNPDRAIEILQQMKEQY